MLISLWIPSRNLIHVNEEHNWRQKQHVTHTTYHSFPRGIILVQSFSFFIFFLRQTDSARCTTKFSKIHHGTSFGMNASLISEPFHASCGSFTRLCTIKRNNTHETLALLIWNWKAYRDFSFQCSSAPNKTACNHAYLCCRKHSWAPNQGVWSPQPGHVQCDVHIASFSSPLHTAVWKSSQTRT